MKIISKIFSVILFFACSSMAKYIFADEYDLKKWTNVSIYNEGGYASWYEAEWYDQNLGTVRNKQSATNTAGYTHEFEFPPHARDIRVKGYSLTGLAWQPNKLIFDKSVGYGEEFDSIDARAKGQYFKIKIWGTTLSPSWAKVSSSISGLDPYATRANECADIRVDYNNNYVNLLSPVRYTVRTINKCHFIVKLRSYNDNTAVDYVLKPNQTVTHYHFSYPYPQKERTNIGDRDSVVVFEHGDFGGAKFGFNSSQPKLPNFISGKLSSYAIPSGWKVRFYESENYKGRYWTRDSNSSDYNFNKDFNDMIKSIEIIEQP